MRIKTQQQKGGGGVGGGAKGHYENWYTTTRSAECNASRLTAHLNLNIDHVVDVNCHRKVIYSSCTSMLTSRRLDIYHRNKMSQLIWYRHALYAYIPRFSHNPTFEVSYALQFLLAKENSFIYLLTVSYPI